MDKPKEYFAWIRIVDVRKEPLPRPDKATEGLPSCDAAGYFVMGGDRWPRAIASRPAKGPSLDTRQCVDIRTDTVRTLYDSGLWGEWSIDAVFGGFGDWAFEVAPVIGDRDVAIEWLASPEGQAWCGDAAENLALIRFEPPPIGPNPGEVGTTGSARAAKAPGVACPDKAGKKGNFQPQDWRKDYWDAARNSTHSMLTDAEVSTVLNDPAFKQWPDEATELGAIDGAMADWQNRESQIRRCMTTASALMYVLAGPNTAQLKRKPHSMLLIDALHKGLRHVVYALKLCCNRERPWSVPHGKPAKILLSDPAFPAHPALPAGHAAFAHTLVKLFASDSSFDLNGMRERAEEVSLDRIVAGLHFPSDIAAGVAFADLVAPRLLSKPIILEKLARARAEWR